MKIIVTGGAGFIGSHVVDRLIENGFEVSAIDNLSTGKIENLNKKAKFYQVDIRSSDISDIIKKENPEIIFHLAAQVDVSKSLENPINDPNINISGSLNLIDTFVKHCGKDIEKTKFIFASTGGAVYGEADIVPTPENYPEYPLSPYGIAKLTVEKYLHWYNKIFSLPFVCLRLGNVYGPRQNSKGDAGVIAIFCDKMLSGEQPIINGDGKQTRDYVFVGDVVDAFILAMKKNITGVFNIGTEIETDLNTLFPMIKELIGANCKEIHGVEKKGEQRRSCLDILKAEEQLNWEPGYTLDEGLEITVGWFKSRCSSA